MNPPALTLLNLIETNWTEINPAKAQIKFLKAPTNIDWAFLLAPRSAGTRSLWVNRGDSPHRSVGFQVRVIHLNLIVNVFLRAVSRSISDIEEATTEEQNMIDEVCRIIPAERDHIADFVPSVKHQINKDDSTQDPPLLAHEIHVQCSFIRYPS